MPSWVGTVGMCPMRLTLDAGTVGPLMTWRSGNERAEFS